MTSSELRALLHSNPDVQLPVGFGKEVEQSVGYLRSDSALASLALDAYWPKWNSPWWHMLLLFEMGLSSEIPEAAVEAMVSALQGLPAKFFPIHEHEIEAGWDLRWDATCHCAAGSIYAVLADRGVDVDGELPWLRPWFSRYHMEDGGMSCDPEAYLVQDESPSSMVGTIPPFEALLYHAANWTETELKVLDRTADFLMERQLHLGSSSNFNAEERESAPRWLLPCFPRLYFYDVLRGLRALLTWSHRRKKKLPLRCLSKVLHSLLQAAPDGVVRCRRWSYAGAGSRVPLEDGSWTWQDQASSFPLLEATSDLGLPSPFLTRQWTECKRLAREILFEPVVLVPPSQDWLSMAQQEAS